MDSMDGIEVPDELPPIKQIDISNEEYQKIMNLFQPERLNPEDCDHSGINIMQHLCSTSKRCSKCNAIFTVCDSLTSMET